MVNYQFIELYENENSEEYPNTYDYEFYCYEYGCVSFKRIGIKKLDCMNGWLIYDGDFTPEAGDPDWCFACYEWEYESGAFEKQINTYVGMFPDRLLRIIANYLIDNVMEF